MDVSIEKFTERLNDLVKLAKKEKNILMQEEICLLYTSDAADEL